MHQTAGNLLQTLAHMNPPPQMTNAKHIVYALVTVMDTMLTTAATTLGSCPGSLAFLQGMFLYVPLIADWQAIAHNREHHVNENLHCANDRMHPQYDYAPGQQVLKTKLGVRTEGPYTIEHLHINCNLPIVLCEGVTK